MKNPIKTIIISALLIATGGCIANQSLKNNGVTWRNFIVPTLDGKLSVEKQTEKSITLRCVDCDEKKDLIVFIEFIDVPHGKSLTMDAYLSKLLESYKALYDKLSITELKLENNRGYKIIHNVLKEKKEMETVILPDKTNFITIVFSTTTEGYDENKKILERILIAMDAQI